MKQPTNEQLQQVLDAAMSAMDAMERWRGIATMMSHFDICTSARINCNHCAIARKTYMEATIEYAQMDAEVLEIAAGLMK